MDPKRLTQILQAAQAAGDDMSGVARRIANGGHAPRAPGVAAKGTHYAAGLLARHAARAGMAGQVRCHRGRII